jgi:HK97 family phage prohead protease
MMERIQKGFALSAEPGPAPRTLKFTISTSDQDRMGDTIDPHGWDFSEWLADGAPVLYGHRHDLPPIGRGLDVHVVGERVVSTMEAPPVGAYELADTVYTLAKVGFLKSASVGFQAEKWSDNPQGGRHFSRQILREWSIVPVPALGQAKIEAGVGALIEKWLGRPVSSESILDLVEDDEDVLAGLNAAEVREDLRQMMPALVAPRSAFDPLGNAADRQQLMEIIRATVPRLVRREANRLRGRIDDPEDWA